MTKTQISRWWTFIYTIILLISLMLIFVTSMGYNGFRYLGAGVSVERDSDYKLYRVDDVHALYVSPKSSDVSLVTYKKERVFRFLGEFSYGKEVFPQVCQKGNWLFTKVASYMEPGRVIAYQYRTGDSLKKEEPARNEIGYTPVNLVEKGLLCQPEFTLNPQKITNFPELDVPRESSITVAVALAIIHILWWLALPFAVKREKI